MEEIKEKYKTEEVTVMGAVLTELICQMALMGNVPLTTLIEVVSNCYNTNKIESDFPGALALAAKLVDHLNKPAAEKPPTSDKIN